MGKYQYLSRLESVGRTRNLLHAALRTAALPALLHLNVSPSGASDCGGSPPIVKLLIIPLPVCYKMALGLAPPSATDQSNNPFHSSHSPLWLPVIFYAAYPCALASYSLVRPNWWWSVCWPLGVGIPSTACVRSQKISYFPIS